MMVAKRCRPGPLAPEQHDAEETGFQEEGREHLIAHQGPEDRPGLVGKDRPVRAELIAHHDARHDAHAEDDREDLHPIAEDVHIDVPPGDRVQRQDDPQIGGEADREGREDDVERDREGELDSRKQDGIETLEHRWALEQHSSVRRDPFSAPSHLGPNIVGLLRRESRMRPFYPRQIRTTDFVRMRDIDRVYSPVIAHGFVMVCISTKTPT